MRNNILNKEEIDEESEDELEDELDNDDDDINIIYNDESDESSNESESKSDLDNFENYNNKKKLNTIKRKFIEEPIQEIKLKKKNNNNNNNINNNNINNNNNNKININISITKIVNLYSKNKEKLLNDIENDIEKLANALVQIEELLNEKEQLYALVNTEIRDKKQNN